MKIKEMKLNNFRLFRHEQEFKFAHQENKPLTVVRAENRTGKTTLLTALQWCLYGDTVLTDTKQSLTDGDLLISLDALRAANPGDVIKTQVELRVEHAGREFILRRARETVRSPDESDSVARGPASFTILAIGPTGSQVVPNPTSLMQQMLPENLRELFLFDGDRINSFMQPHHQEAVQKAVSDMLEFELFDEALRHLKSVLAEYRTKLRGTVTGQAKQLREQQAKLDTQLDSIHDELTRLNTELTAEQAIEEQLTIEIAGEPGDAGTIQQRVNALSEQIKRLEDAKAKLGLELGRQLGQGTYFTVPALVDKARKLLLEKKEAGEIPKRIGEDLIKERLELGICICGRPLTSGEAAYDHLQQELSRQKDRAVFDEIATEALYYLNSFARRNKDELRNQLNDILAQRINYQETIVSIAKQATELEQQLDKIDIDAIERKRKAISETRRRMHSLMMSIADNQQKEQTIRQQLDDVQKRLRQAERRDEHNKALRRREDITEDCLKALTLTYQNVREIERHEISVHTQENFFRMNLRRDEFEKVEVTPSFRLQIIAPGGYIANPVLSGAQRRALSLAFLFALIQVSERDALVIVDTPLGMTSGPMRRSIAQAMINQTEQLILLLTRAEIQGVEDILQASASAQLTLTCSHDYPIELANPPRYEGAYTQVCQCDINSHCPVCERIPTIAVSEPDTLST